MRCRSDSPDDECQVRPHGNGPLPEAGLLSGLRRRRPAGDGRSMLGSAELFRLSATPPSVTEEAVS